MPPVDEQQDIEMTAITTENGVTTVQFRRQRDTGDSMDDLTLDVCQYFLYAWGGTFDTNNPSSLGIHSHREASPYQVCIPPDTICKGRTLYTVIFAYIYVLYNGFSNKITKGL